VKKSEIENELRYSLYLFYANEDLIIEYDYRVAPEKKILLCPLTDKFQGAWLWLGKNPDYAPLVEITQPIFCKFESKISTVP
jgi:hypothetical protein